MYAKVYIPKPSEDLLKLPLLSVSAVVTVDPYIKKLTVTPLKALPLSILTEPLIVPEGEGEVVNPFVVYALTGELLEVSLAEVVILSLNIVPPLRLSLGVAVNAVLLSEAEGVADILTQVVKLSEES